MTGVTLAVWWSRTFVGNVICNQYEIQKGGFENRFVGPKITRWKKQTYLLYNINIDFVFFYSLGLV